MSYLGRNAEWSICCVLCISEQETSCDNTYHDGKIRLDKFEFAGNEFGYNYKNYVMQVPIQYAIHFHQTINESDNLRKKNICTHCIMIYPFVI